MHRLALHIAFKYLGAAGFFLAFLSTLGHRSLFGLVGPAMLAVAVPIYAMLLQAICPPALRPPKRQPSGRLVTWRGIVHIVVIFVLSLGGILVFFELLRAGVIAIHLQSGTQVISLRLLAGVLIIIPALFAIDFMAKKDELDQANETEA